MVSTVTIDLVKIDIVIKFERIVEWVEFGTHGHSVLGQGLHQVGEENAEDRSEDLAEIGTNLFTLKTGVLEEECLELLGLSLAAAGGNIDFIDAEAAIR